MTVPCIVKWLVTYIIGLLCIAVALTVSWPLVMQIYTWRSGGLMSVEQSVRWSAWAVVALLAFFVFVWGFLKGYIVWKRIGIAMFIVLVLFVPLFAFDPTSIRDEDSWIRYPTALFLFLAGAVMWFISRRYNQGEQLPKPKEWIWIVLGLGLWFAAADEIVQIHERIGTFFENLLHLPHVFSDFVTVGYGVVGSAVLAVFFWLRKRGDIQAGDIFERLYLAGFALFITATVFDTTDFIVHKVLVICGAWLATVAPGFLSSFFTFWYDPKLLLNGIEEIFESMAALLFFTGSVHAGFDMCSTVHQSSFSGPVAECHSDRVRRRAEESSHLIVPQIPRFARRLTRDDKIFAYSIWQPSFAVKRNGMAAMFFVICLLFVVPWFVPNLMYSVSPFLDNRHTQMLMSARDGLFHTDGLAYDKKIGLVIGNESSPQKHKQFDGPGVFVWQPNKRERLFDPYALLVDSDSVSIHNNTIYASDGLRGVIYFFDNEKKGFYPLVGTTDGLEAPEAIGWYNNDMYVVNEKRKAIMHITRDKKVIFDIPKHPLWHSPEEIVYGADFKTFLVTDDITGTVFQYMPGTPVTVFADQFDGLIAPESIVLLPNGNVFVSDNGTGKMIEFTRDGKVTQRYQMKFAYRDLQGIAIGENSELFFVTADGYDSRSPMPSFVWSIMMPASY